MTNKFNIKNLSQHLFWDIDIENLEAEKNKILVIQRVLKYGLLSDWQQIYRYYGIIEIAETATKIRDLDLKSASFISLLSNIPKDRFLCYSIRQSTPRHWDF